VGCGRRKGIGRVAGRQDGGAPQAAAVMDVDSERGATMAGVIVMVMVMVMVIDRQLWTEKRSSCAECDVALSLVERTTGDWDWRLDTGRRPDTERRGWPFPRVASGVGVIVRELWLEWRTW
jgi:hypothetical protein